MQDTSNKSTRTSLSTSSPSVATPAIEVTRDMSGKGSASALGFDLDADADDMAKSSRGFWQPKTWDGLAGCWGFEGEREQTVAGRVGDANRGT